MCWILSASRAELIATAVAEPVEMKADATDDAPAPLAAPVPLASPAASVDEDVDVATAVAAPDERATAAVSALPCATTVAAPDESPSPVRATSLTDMLFA